jgi:hypothetical protein
MLASSNSSRNLDRQRPIGRFAYCGRPNWPGRPSQTRSCWISMRRCACTWACDPEPILGRFGNTKPPIIVGAP